MLPYEAKFDIPLCHHFGVGTQSQKRRDAKRRNLQHHNREAAAEDAMFRRLAQNPNPASPSQFDPEAASAIGRSAIIRAIHALQRGNEEDLLCAVETLAALPGNVGAHLVETRLFQSMSILWSSGWQPLDIVHVITKHFSPDHRAMCVAGIGAEFHQAQPAFVDPRWASQLDQLTPTDGQKSTCFSEPASGSILDELRRINELRVALEIIEFTSRLPILPSFLPPPGTQPIGVAVSPRRTSHLDEKVLSKVRSLLAKAESTTFEEEADALTSKAQELMARHAIDIAMLDARSSVHDSATARRIHLDDPYSDAKSMLLGAVANENRCRAVLTPNFAFCTVFGFDTDLDIVELLFTSLLTQATTSMMAAGKTVDSWGQSTTRSFRKAFLVAFAQRIGERLRSATKHATDEAKLSIGDSLVPVLATREAAVTNFSDKIFPKTVSRSTSVTNVAGWHAGRQAADRASLDHSLRGIQSR